MKRFAHSGARCAAAGLIALAGGISTAIGHAQTALPGFRGTVPTQEAEPPVGPGALPADAPNRAGTQAAPITSTPSGPNAQATSQDLVTATALIGPAVALPAPAGPIAAPGRPLAVSPLPPVGGPLTITQAVALALQLNPEIAQANAVLLSSEGVTGEARSQLRPTLTADGGGTAYANGIDADRDGGTVVYSADHLLPTVGAQATLPIDIGGYLHAATDEAKFTEIAARLDVNAARNEVVANVETAFYAVLRAQALVNVARENLADSTARLTDARQKFANQTVGILDVVRAQTDVAQGQQRLISAQDQVALNLSSLNNAIGLNVNAPLAVTDAGAVEQPPGVAPPSVPPITATNEAPALPENSAPGNAPPSAGAGSGALNSDMAAAAAVAADIARSNANEAVAQVPSASFDVAHPSTEFTSLLSEALQSRPEVLQGKAQIEAARKGIVYARRSKLPSMALGLRYEYAAPTYGTSIELNNLQAFVGLSFPINDGGLTRARIQEAQGQEAQAQISERQAVDSVSLDVRQAYTNLLDAKARVAVANQSLAQAREAFLIALIRYNAGVTAKAGLSPLLELSDAQAALVGAEADQVGAVYDYNQQLVRVNYAVGRYSYPSPWTAP